MIRFNKRLFSKEVVLNKWKREWFYFIDHKGMLFNEDTHPKNYTSCLKDTNFLNFFYKNIRKNETGEF